ncbi:MAG: polyphosphate kinase 1 [Acidimicrobiales bacterium]
MTDTSVAEDATWIADRYFNRELSWLAFNDRVLAQAADPAQPLLERLKFIAIWGSNLDEFFQVRVAGLKNQVEAKMSTRTPDGRTPSMTLTDIRDEVDRQLDVLGEVYAEVVDALDAEGISLVTWADLTAEDRLAMTAHFENRIFPVLTPLAVDPGHPFPYISNLSLSLGVILRDPRDGNRRFARLKMPPVLGRFIALSATGDASLRFITLEEVVFAHVDQLFPGMEVVETIAFRVTRNADLEIDEEEVSNLMSAVELELRRRRFQQAVRLQLSRSLSADVAALLVKELELGDDDVYVTDVPLSLVDLFELVSLDRPELRDPPHVPVTPLPFRTEDDEPVDIFELLRERDVLVHHPYESFITTVDEMLRQAARDPLVQAIKMTLYRTSGDSPVVEHLIRAAESGKQVAVVVELKARFDEAANIGWARRLEDAGVHVAYGLVGLKVHTKTLLVVRSEPDGVHRYCHVGTGNYNAKTARMYTDLGLLTSDPDIGHDLSQLFNGLTGYGRHLAYRKLVVAPDGLRGRITDLIRNEAEHGPDGHIAMKMNSLVDADMIDELYMAAQAGVRIDLLIRGICCLRPGVPGLSETVRVRSLIGRFLEHPRIFRFAHGDGPGRPVHLIGSADLMPRNLDRRVEALTPIEHPALRARLDELFQLQLADRWLAWDLDASGTWVRCAEDPATSSQQLLIARASE